MAVPDRPAYTKFLGLSCDYYRLGPLALPTVLLPQHTGGARRVIPTRPLHARRAPRYKFPEMNVSPPAALFVLVLTNFPPALSPPRLLIKVPYFSARRGYRRISNDLCEGGHRAVHPMVTFRTLISGNLHVEDLRRKRQTSTDQFPDQHRTRLSDCFPELFCQDFLCI